jgi:hypothetical protein
MAVVRAELGIPEVEALLDALPRPDRGTDLFRARRELERALLRGRQLEAEERANMARIRAKRRAMSMDDEPLIPQSMSRLVR